MRPLLIHRYVIREFLPPLGVGLLVSTFVLILHQIFLMMDLFLNRGVETGTILKMAGLIIPMFLPISIPMASLFGALISYGRLSEDGELTALRSSGCAHIQYVWPNVFLGLVFSLFLIHFNLNLAPRSTAEFREIYHSVAKQNPLALFAPRIMNHFGEYKVIINEMDRKKKRLTGIAIYKMNPTGAPTRILAPEGELNSFPGEGIMLSLANGAIHQPNPNKENEYTITKFSKFALRIPTTIESEQRPLTPRELTYSQLKNKIEESGKNHSDPAPWQTEKDLRIAIAFAPLVFIVLGTTLGIRIKKGNKAIGVGMSVVVILIYYGLYYPMISLASRGFFASSLLTWMPNITALGIGVFLWSRLIKQ